MLEEFNEEEEDDNKEEKKSLKRKKTKLRKSIEGEDQEEEEEPKKSKKRKKRSKTTVKDKITPDENDYLEGNTEKPRRRKTLKKKRHQQEEGGNNSNNEENEGNGESGEKKKKKRKRKRKPQTDDENENNENENGNNDVDEETKVKKRKKRKKRKEENEENDENNEENENEEETSVKKKKKKKRKLLEKINENDNILDTKEVKNEFYTQVKKYIKKKKKKKKKENEENEDADDIKFRTTLPLLSNKLKATKIKKKIVNKLLSDKIKNSEHEEININDNNENDNINKDVDINNFSNSEENWKNIKKDFLKTIEDYLNEITLFEHIDIAIVSTVSLIKKEYGEFYLTKHHDIYPIKNFNNINWAKEPYRKLQDKFYELAAPGKLISNNNYLDFSNRVCNEYEVYTAQIPLIKISGNNITEEMEPQDFHFLSKEEDKIIKKPHLLLFFSFEDEKSILFYKEALEYLKINKDKFIFLPIYAPLIQAQKNIYFVTDMLYRNKVYKKGDQFEIYFCNNDALSKRFKYISNDNKRTIICKTAFIDIINDKFIVRAVRSLDSFTFNLIDSGKQINKKEHKKIIKNLQIFKNNSKRKLKNTSLSEPYNCHLILRKAKIYNISKNKRELKVRYTLYDSLTGNLNGHDMYKAGNKKYEKLCKIFNDLFYYKLRANPKSLSLSKEELNIIILEEIAKCTEKNDELKEATCQAIFQTQKIIMTLGANTNQVFEPIKSKSFKLDLHIKYKLFDELNTMNIIGSLYGLTLFPYFNNCDYVACIPKIGETFPNKLNLTNHKTLKDEQMALNPNQDRPSLLIIFSLAFQNYFASSELSSRFKLIIKKLNSFYENGSISVILIYRGEPSKFSIRFEQVKDDPIFDLDYPLYIQSSADMKFPLVIQNNDIESTDSQIIAYILNKKNKLVYTGNLEDIELDRTFQKLCDDNTNNIDNIVAYKENAKLPYDDFKKMINSAVSKIEKIIEEEIKKEDKLLYRPFFTLSYNSYTNFENGETDNERYINHIRLRILVKEKHESIFIKNPEFKNIIGQLKKYGTSTIVDTIPCEDIELIYNCTKCQKKLEIDENNPVYFDMESNSIFCEKCGEEFSVDIKNDTFVTFFNTKNYSDEVISEIYENYNKRNITINPVLGDNCKICRNKIGDCFYLNLTNFNIDYIESPLIPIDICDDCFNAMRSGDSFLNEPLKRYNYEKFGLNYKHMIYRKIFIPLEGK